MALGAAHSRIAAMQAELRRWALRALLARRRGAARVAASLAVGAWQRALLGEFRTAEDEYSRLLFAAQEELREARGAAASLGPGSQQQQQQPATPMGVPMGAAYYDADGRLFTCDGGGQLGSSIPLPGAVQVRWKGGEGLRMRARSPPLPRPPPPPSAPPSIPFSASHASGTLRPMTWRGTARGACAAAAALGRVPCPGQQQQQRPRRRLCATNQCLAPRRQRQLRRWLPVRRAGVAAAGGSCPPRLSLATRRRRRSSRPQCSPTPLLLPPWASPCSSSSRRSSSNRGTVAVGAASTASPPSWGSTQRM